MFVAFAALCVGIFGSITAVFHKHPKPAPVEIVSIQAEQVPGK